MLARVLFWGLSYLTPTGHWIIDDEDVEIFPSTSGKNAWQGSSLGAVFCTLGERRALQARRGHLSTGSAVEVFHVWSRAQRPRSRPSPAEPSAFASAEDVNPQSHSHRGGGWDPHGSPFSRGVVRGPFCNLARKGTLRPLTRDLMLGFVNSFRTSSFSRGSSPLQKCEQDDEETMIHW